MKTIQTMRTSDLTRAAGLSLSDITPEVAAAMLLDAHVKATKKPAAIYTKAIPADEWRAAFTGSNGQRFIVHGNRAFVKLSVA
jgi:hypothetical protein